MLVVTARVPEIDFAMLDDRVRPVRDVERTIRSEFYVDWPEGYVGCAHQLSQLPRGIAGTLLFNGKAHDAMGAKIAGDSVALPLRWEMRAADYFQATELRIITWADALQFAAH